jgi:signal transduction histidine kinase
VRAAASGDTCHVDVNQRKRASGPWPGVLAVAQSAALSVPSAPGRRASLVDAALAAAFAVAALFALRLDHYPLLAPGSLHVSGQAVVLSLVATVPLALRRIRPFAAFGVILLATPGIRSQLTPVIYLAVVTAGYSAIVYSRFRGAAMLTVPLAGGLVLGAVPGSAPPFPARAMPFAVLAAIALIGDAVYRWRQRAGDSQARIGRLQAEHEESTRQVLQAERARLASEMHDVVTHNVSVMVIQAGAARQILTDAPGRAREALLAVESAGRAAMTELGQLLALLAPAAEHDAAESPDLASPARAPGAAALRPQPGLRQLDSLIERVTAAGLPVRLQTSGRPAVLPPSADLTAYRVVQEALTNVLKHADQSEAEVRLDYRPRELIVEVADAGRASGGSALVSEADRITAPDSWARSGRGLAGLRQRLGLSGGELDAGRRPGGGWQVRARIPLPASGAMGADGADG